MRRLLLAVLTTTCSTSLAAQRAELRVPLEVLESRAVSDSNDPVAHYELALGYLVTHRFGEAERELQTSIDIEPRMAASYLALGMMPYARNPRLWEEKQEERASGILAEQLEEAARLRRLAFMLDPLVDLKVLGAVVPPRAPIKTRGGADPYVDLVRGLESFWVGGYAEAYERFNRLIGVVRKYGSGPVPGFLFWYRGLAAAHTDRYAAALQDINELYARAAAFDTTASLVYQPFVESNELRYIKAIIQVQAGQSDSAIVLLQQALETDLGLYPAHSLLASIHESRRQWSAAVLERRRALEARPDDPGLLLELGNTLALSGRHLEAIRVFRTAMVASPRNARIPYLCGMAATRIEDAKMARTCFERFVAIAPSRFAPQVAEAQDRLAALP